MKESSKFYAISIYSSVAFYINYKTGKYSNNCFEIGITYVCLWIYVAPEVSPLL